MELDGIPGLTEGDELVYDGTVITSNQVIHMDCETCTCGSDNTLQCTPDDVCECTYGPWEIWGDCSVTCGYGWRQRSRHLLAGHILCPEQEFDNPEQCYEGECPTTTPPPCSTWSTWSFCDCYTGIRSRTRQSTNPSNPCPDLVETDSCLDTCATTPYTCIGGKNPVSCYNPCDDSCLDYRIPGTCVDAESCIPGCECPSGMRYYNGQCINETDCPCYDDDGLPILQDGVKKYNGPCEECVCNAQHQFECTTIPGCCEWSDWSYWSDCSKSCEWGLRYRTRTVLGGDGCDMDKATEIEPCSLTDMCPPECVINGEGYNMGDVISNCTCEICVCSGNGEEVCLPKSSANVDGGFSAWSAWGQCTKSCTGGHRSRTRECNNPLPRCAGQACYGSTVDTEPCNDNISCCDVTDWSDWGPCNTTCGPGGFKTRTRTYVNPGDEAYCSKPLEELAECHENLPCDVDCGVSQWSSWSACDAQCGLGKRDRTRDVANPTTAGCGDIETFQEEPCFMPDCVCAPPFVWKNDSLCHDMTCDAMYVDPYCDEELLAGCVCPEGLYKKDGKCVELQRCYDCEVNGESKNSGEIWTPEGTCEICQCVNGQVKCHPNMDIPVCADNEELSYDDGPCCPKCIPQQDTCQLKTAIGELKYGDNCVTETVTYQFCSGTCGNSQSLPGVILAENGTPFTVNDCRCCSGIPSNSTIEVMMTCTNNLGGTESLVGYIPILAGCECKACS